MSGSRSVAVIGAGIVGVSTARYLQRSGHIVTLIDPNPPGDGASFGNAGCFNPSSMVPIAGPDTFKSVPGYLMDPLGPLSIRWRYLPRIAPWLIRYGLAGTTERIKQQAAALSSLLGTSLEALAPLVEDAGAQDLIRRDGILIVYRSQASRQADERGWNLRREAGIKWQDLDHGELHAFDPHLTPDAAFGKWVPGNGHTVDPGGLVRKIAECVLGSGGRLVRARATGFAFDDNRLRGVVTDQGLVTADAAVIAAGAFSKDLALAAGDRLPLETERGYHAVIKDPAIEPRVPTTDSDYKFVVAPMNMGVRIAGTVELAGLHAPPNWKRSQILLHRIGALYPALAKQYRQDEVTVWMGHRPSFPDSLPVIDRASRSPDIFYAFGHGHVGMTGGPFTGVIISDLISGKPSPIDLSPFKATRFQ
jgi:D-amino-acid dehydrogenase